MRTIKNIRLWVAALLGVFVATFGAQAQFSSDFSSPPVGPTMSGSTKIENGRLSLTDAVNSQQGFYTIPDFTGGLPVGKFKVSFKMRIGGGTCCGTRTADGVSLSFAPDIPASPNYTGEEGGGTGIIISFDTWDNNGTDTAPSIDVKLGGAGDDRIVRTQSMDGTREGGRAPATPLIVDPATGSSMTLTTGDNFVDVVIIMESDGTLDLDYKGVRIFNNVQTAYQPITGGTWSFAARTGGANDNQWIDDLSIETFTAGPPFVVSEPQDATILAGRTATFSAVVDGTPPIALQWFKNDAPIGGANSPSYTTPPAPVSDSGSKYKLVATSALGTATTREAVLTVTPDTTPPTLVSAASDDTLTAVTVVFSEPVDVNAEDNFNYTLDVGTVSGATRVSPTTIRLTVSGLLEGTVHTLTVNSINDTSIPPNPIAANSTATFKTLSFSRGFILKEYYLGINGVTAADLRNHPRFINRQPDQSCFASQFEFNTFDEYENYGGRMVGFFLPNESGPHQFYLSADDGAELYLSTDSSPANKALIASEAQWRGRREWTTPSNGGSQNALAHSPVIELVAGQRYYIESIFKEGGGGDNMAVAFKGPSALAADPTSPPNGSAPIPGSMLGILTTDAGKTLTITQQPASVTVDENMNATFTVAASSTGVPSCANGGANVTYQWQKNGVDIAGATGTSYSTGPAPRTDNDAKIRVIVSIPGIVQTSAEATLTVNPDLVPPTIVSAGGSASFDSVTAVFSELMQQGDLEDNFNFSLDGGVSITSATMLSDGMSVLLGLDPGTPLIENTVYTLTVINVKDLVGNPIVDGTKQFRSFVVGCPSKVIFEAYNAGGGTDINILKTHASFPNSPDARGEIATFNSRLFYPGDGRENYGGRMRGYFFAPASGPHVFYLAADDGAELYLSTDSNPANKAVIARENLWSAHREWTASSGGSNLANKRSTPINLVAGQAYYMEAIYKEGGGGDHCAVAVQIPGGPVPANGANEIDPRYLGAIAGAGSIGQLTIDQQPADITVEENRAATFTARGSAPAGTDPQLAAVCYQWLLNGVEIPGATSASYTTPPVQTSDNGNRYSVRIAIIGDKETSQEAVLTVTEDNTAPKLLSAAGSADLKHVTLTFDELMDPGTGADTFNYSIPGLTVNSATVNGANVTLETSDQTIGGNYTVTVNNVQDAAGNPIGANNTASFQAWVLASGFATRDFFNGIGGVVPADLVANPKYPSSPDRSERALNLESPKDFQDVNHGDIFNDYGTRVHGWIRPPVSARYNFAISADDGAEFWLSTDDSPVNMVKIAAEPVWNGVRDFNGTARRNAAAPENRSTSVAPAGILLEAGRRYFFQGLMKEGGGGDNFSVTWQRVSDPVIPTSGNHPAGEAAPNAIDGDPTTKYLNFDKFNTGFAVTPAVGPTVVTGLRLTTANDADGRDPMTFLLEGTTGDPAVGPYVAIASGNTGLGTARFSTAPDISFANATPYTSYRITFPTIRDPAANSMQIAEVAFLDASGRDVTQDLPAIRNLQATISGIHLQTLVPPGDTTAPTLVSAVRDGTQAQVNVVFSEIVERDSANTAANYSISGGTVTRASIQGDGKTVVLSVTGAGNGPCQTVTVSGVKDSVGNTIAAGSTIELIKPGAHLASGAQNLIVVEAENYDFAYTPPQGITPNGWTVNSAVAGASGGRYIELVPNMNTFYGDDFLQFYGSAPRVDYSVYFPVAGTWFLHARGDSQNDGGNNSFHAALDGKSELPFHQRIGNGTQNWGSPWGWVRGAQSGNARFIAASAGYHTISIYAREDGIRIDKFVLTTDSGFTIPAADAGPANSARESNATPLPVAAITSPTEGQRFEACSSATIKATASVECGGTIARVIFLANGSPIGSDSSAPYELTIPVAPPGSYSLVAVAEDTQGRQGASAPVNVIVLNTAPSFTGGPDQVSAEDAGPQSVAGFASNISKGSAACEAGQAIAFILTSDNSSLFSAGPAIAPDGTLSYTAAPDANGVANVTAVLRDDGGNAGGGSDTSAPHHFRITIAGVNDCPSSADQAVTTAEDTAATINLGPATDTDGDPIIYSVTTGAANGTVAIAGNTATYTPAANYCGPDSFKFSVTDGICPRVEYTVSITVTCVNDPPTCDITMRSLDCSVVYEKSGKTWVVSGNGSDAALELTTEGYDAEGDALTYLWTDEDGNVLGTTKTIQHTFPLGCHRVTVVVADGASSSTCTKEFCVIDASEALDQCIALVDGSDISRKNKRPLIASLKAAQASYDRGSLGSCLGQLHAFENKCRAQVAPEDPDDAAAFIECVQHVIQAVSCARNQ